jgi:hypothetical protein
VTREIYSHYLSIYFKSAILKKPPILKISLK